MPCYSLVREPKDDWKQLFMKSLLDFIPLIVFFTLYKTTDRADPNHPLLQAFGLSGGVNNNHILVATFGLMLSTLVIYGALFIIQKFRLQKQQWLIVLMTVIFGGLTLVFSDDYYIRLKAVLINLGFMAGVLISPWITKDGQSVMRKLFGSVLELSDGGWRKLNLAWAGLFGLMASLHAFFAFVFMGGEYWGEFTAFGDMIVMFAFIAGMFFVLRKHFKAQ